MYILCHLNQLLLCLTDSMKLSTRVVNGPTASLEYSYEDSSFKKGMFISFITFEIMAHSRSYISSKDNSYHITPSILKSLISFFIISTLSSQAGWNIEG